MGEAFLSGRGGWRRRALGGRAVIAAAYPAGSACSCESGGTVLADGEKTGAAAFAVPSTGTWTVRCTDGERSCAQTVSITHSGQAELVRLGYVLPLLTAEDGLADGFLVQGNAALSGGAILESGSGGFVLSPAVDLTGYSQISVTGTMLTALYGDSRICAGSTAEKVRDPLQTPEAAAAWGFEPGTEKTVVIDVSALSGSFHIGTTELGNHLEITAIVLS